MYGRIRLGGTLGWGLFAPIAGALVLKYGLNIAFLGFRRDHVPQSACQSEVFLWQAGGTCI